MLRKNMTCIDLNEKSRILTPKAGAVGHVRRQIHWILFLGDAYKLASTDTTATTKYKHIDAPNSFA